MLNSSFQTGYNNDGSFHGKEIFDHAWICYPLYIREFDTLKCKKVPQSLEIGLFFCQIFIFII